MKALSWKRSLLISLVIHLVVLCALFFWYLGRTPDAEPGQGPTQDRQRPAPTAAGADDETPDPEKLFERENRRVAKMSDAEKMRRLDDLSDGKLRGVRKSSLKEITSRLERAKGVDRSRWYTPNPDATGRYDANTTVLYDIARRTRDGKEIYVYTFVDAAGRTLKTDRPAARMTASDLRSFRVFEMARKSPGMRRLLESAIRIGETMIQQPQQPQAPAASGPAKP